MVADPTVKSLAGVVVPMPTLEPELTITELLNPSVEENLGM